MACIRKRRDRWVADWRDGAGLRRWRSFATKREAEDFLARELPRSRQRTQPTLDARITVRAYAEHWFPVVRATRKPATAARYEQQLRLHILPAFGAQPIRTLERAPLAHWLAGRAGGGLAPGTVHNLLAVLRVLLHAAVDDGVLPANPADRLGRALRLTASAEAPEPVKAMTAEQRRRFLDAADRACPRYAPLFRFLAGTGARLGEGLALQWEDVDPDARTARISKSLAGRRLGTTKSGRARVVDLSGVLAGALGRLLADRKAETLRQGWPAVPPWVFCTQEGTPLSQPRVRTAMLRALKASGLPEHFTPHGLRHSYASILLQQGASIAYVQRQLGHRSIKLTVDVYGAWLPLDGGGALDRLDAPPEESGSKTVAIHRVPGDAGAEAVDIQASFPPAPPKCIRTFYTRATCRSS